MGGLRLKGSRGTGVMSKQDNNAVAILNVIKTRTLQRNLTRSEHRKTNITQNVDVSCRSHQSKTRKNVGGRNERYGE